MPRPAKYHAFPLYLAFTLLVSALAASSASAQVSVDPPDRRFIFLEDKAKKDRTKAKKQELKKKKQARQSLSVQRGSIPFDMDAQSISSDQTGKTVSMDGDITITYGATIVDAREGKVNIESKDVELKGDVLISDATGTVSADAANFNLDTGEGTLENAKIFSEDGDYRFQAEEVERFPGPDDEFLLKDANLTTCQCAERGTCAPWSLSTGEAKIKREGYGSAWNTILRVCDVPVMYLPYMYFPVKSERSSGLLTPTFGLSQRTGLDLQLPIYLVFDNSSDATVMPVYQSSARIGVDTEVRKIFSRKEKVEGGLVYFDESRRKGRLLGTNINALFDPTFDETRNAGYLKYNRDGTVGTHPYQVILDGRFISDDLFIREYEKTPIGLANSRFLTSTALVRTPVLDSYSFDVSAEFNQSIVSDDSFVFQRLPDVALTGFDSYRPFGQNLLGLKLVHEQAYTGSNFQRTKSYDGSRVETFQRLRAPFHVYNYFDAEVASDVRASSYKLDETEEILFGVPADQPQTRQLKDSSSRVVPGFDAKVGTVFEKVFEVSEGNPIKELAELGSWGQNERLARLKHTIEPQVRYRYVPEVDQDDNPQFDSVDKLARRNVATGILTQRLLSRSEPRNQYLYGIEETTPELKDLGTLRTPGLLDQKFAFGLDADQISDFQGLKTGSLRELATLRVGQSYDFDEAKYDRVPNKSALSDFLADLSLYPNEYLRFRGTTNYNVQNSNFTNYTIESQLLSKRGDEVRNRFGFVDGQVRQLETGLQLTLTERVKLGYYSRYDDLLGQFNEQGVGLRFASACKCWIFDIDFRDRINPDETRMFFNLTLVGLGGIGNTFFSAINNSQTSTLGQ